MKFRRRVIGRSGRLVAASLMIAGAFSAAAGTRAAGQDALHPPAASLPAPRPSGAITPSSHGPRVPPGPPRAMAAGSSVIQGEIHYNGTPTPGAPIEVGLDGPLDPSASYNWVQIDGPPVTIDDDTRPRIRFNIPEGTQQLVFLMTVRNARGQRTARVTIPIQGAAPARPQDATLRADAGDDQIGLVGRRITLNGSRSAPGRGIIYRWFQLAGPKVEQALQEKYYYAFTPVDPGIYRFGLIVAASSGSGEVSLSDLDEVVVTVGEMPSTFGSPSLGGVAGPAPLAALDQALQGPGSIAIRATLDQVAGVLEAISARATLYTSFAELSSEMMRRLDAAIPADPNARQFWAQAVFSPLTQHTMTDLLAVGLDLRLPQGHQQPLNPAQQERLRKLFAGYAREFRSRTQAR